ncbi:hypothetical protein [Bacillus velezensis]|nr:hypothetical protein [Bacillus velezensis]
MNRKEIFEVFKQNIYEVVPEIEGVKITIEDSLQDLGQTRSIELRLL